MKIALSTDPLWQQHPRGGFPPTSLSRLWPILASGPPRPDFQTHISAFLSACTPIITSPGPPRQPPCQPMHPHSHSRLPHPPHHNNEHHGYPVPPIATLAPKPRPTPSNKFCPPVHPLAHISAVHPPTRSPADKSTANRGTATGGWGPERGVLKFRMP